MTEHEGYVLNKKKEFVLKEYQDVVDEVISLKKVHYTQKNRIFKKLAVYLNVMLELEREQIMGEMGDKIKGK